jgi:hypothetical protein
VIEAVAGDVGGVRAGAPGTHTHSQRELHAWQCPFRGCRHGR